MKITFEEIEVSEIQPYKGKTYDFEVEEDHSYNIEGTIVHNSACLTSPNTGFGTRGWQLSALAAVSEALDVDIDLICDGGIRTYGDIAKAIAFGAKAVMVGGMFAAHDESPGELVEEHGEYFKAFYGSASAQQKGHSKNVEGKSMMLPYRGAIAHTLETMTDNLQSAVSYAGGTKLEDLTRVGYVLLGR